MRVWLACVVLTYTWTAAAFAGCGNETFNVLLRRFVLDTAFQRERIRYPLTVGLGADPPAGLREPVRERWSREAIASRDRPIMLTPEERREHRIKETLEALSPTRVRVNHFLPEADSYLVEYVFGRTAGCWYQIRLEDVSL